MGYSTRRPNSVGHTVLQYPDVSPKNRQPDVSKGARDLSVLVSHPYRDVAARKTQGEIPT